MSANVSLEAAAVESRALDSPRLLYGGTIDSLWNLYAHGRHIRSMATAAALPEDLAAPHHGPKESLPKLMLGAIGVVYGDIGTSPLYTMKESFLGPHPLAVDRLHIFGVLSLIFWSLMLVVTVKYVFVAMRADNKGEGGSFALLSLISRNLGHKKWAPTLVLLGVLATCLFYGDAMITPAISVLSAVEGLTIVEAGLQPLVIPIAIGILLALFLVQSRGTAMVGGLFGPVILIYMAVLAALGISNILVHPEIVTALSPTWAARFFLINPKLAFLALGSVFLAVTGAETLYADMGHFGRKAIGFSWLGLVYPCLILNYFGQGALMLGDPQTAMNPFYLMAPEWARLPLVAIATAATIIASQAVISGAFSVTHQAVQLGFLPRLKTEHTSEKAAGQIYIPAVNWGLLMMVIVLVLGFRESGRLASAYGIAVTGTMLITTIMLAVLVFQVWRWNKLLAAVTIGLFLIVDGTFFASNITKIPDGGWFPLLVAAVTFTVLTTWATGRRLLRDRLEESSLPLPVFVKSARSAHRIKGTSVFLSASPDSIPSALLHNLKHNQVLHERVVILTVKVEEVPHIGPAERLNVDDAGGGFYRVALRYGFMDEVDIPRDLASFKAGGAGFHPMSTSFFLGRQKVIPSKRPGMAQWREKLFAWLMQSSESAMDFFKLPTNRVIELGTQVEI
jgi:KUP system potassium uptake protein